MLASAIKRKQQLFALSSFSESPVESSLSKASNDRYVPVNHQRVPVSFISLLVPFLQIPYIRTLIMETSLEFRGTCVCLSRTEIVIMGRDRIRNGK